MERSEETQEIEEALKRQAEPTHLPVSELAKHVGIGVVRANIIFYRSADGPDEPDRRLAA